MKAIELMDENDLTELLSWPNQLPFGFQTPLFGVAFALFLALFLLLIVKLKDGKGRHLLLWGPLAGILVITVAVIIGNAVTSNFVDSFANQWSLNEVFPGTPFYDLASNPQLEGSEEYLRALQLFRLAHVLRGSVFASWLRLTWLYAASAAIFGVIAFGMVRRKKDRLLPIGAVFCLFLLCISLIDRGTGMSLKVFFHEKDGTSESYLQHVSSYDYWMLEDSGLAVLTADDAADFVGELTYTLHRAVNIYAEPDEDSDLIRVLQPGTELSTAWLRCTALKENGDWAYVEYIVDTPVYKPEDYPYVSIGWVRKSNLLSACSIGNGVLSILARRDITYTESVVYSSGAAVPSGMMRSFLPLEPILFCLLSVFWVTTAIIKKRLKGR